MPRRHMTLFRSNDSSRIYSFPLLGGEFEEVRELVTPNMRAVGMNGSVDLLGYAKGIKGPRLIAVRGIISGDTITEVDDAIESALSTPEMIGRGVLVASNNHWTPARFIEPLEASYIEGQHLYMPYSMMFRADEDWYGETEEEDSNAVSGVGASFNVNNPGTLRALVMEIEIRGTASGNMTSITLTNLNNGYSIGTNRDLNGTAQRVLIKTQIPSMEYSNDSGASWTADWANRIVGNNQAQLFVLEPGDNTILANMTGVTSATVIFRFYPPFSV